MGKWMLIVILSILLQEYNGEKTVDEMLNNLVSYDHRVPPHGAEGPGSPVKVRITLYITALKVDDIKQEMSADIFVRHHWTDPRLEYNDEATKIKLLNYEDLAKIWKPDLYFGDEIQGNFNTIPVPNVKIDWRNDGSVYISMRLSMTFRCEMDMTYYPHDEQTCNFAVQSYAHTQNEVDITWLRGDNCNDAVMIQKYVYQKNFNFVRHNCSTMHETLVTGNYSQLGVSVTFRRNSGFFMRKLYIPYILLTIVSWLSLWINPRFLVLRLSLLFSVMFIMLLIAFGIYRYVPPVPYTKSIDIWTAFCISLVFTLFLEFVFLAQKSETKEARDISQTGADVEPLEKNGKDSKYHLLKFQVFRAKSYGKSMFYRKADLASRLIFPTLFGIFNVIYWSVYAP